MIEISHEARPASSRLLVVIVNYKTAQLTLACLRSLESEIKTVAGAHVAIVENASGEGALLSEAVQKNNWEAWVTLHVATNNGGFGAGNNVAIKRALACGASCKCRATDSATQINCSS